MNDILTNSLNWLFSNSKEITELVSQNKLEWFVSIGLGFSLAACCGFRIFLPFFVASLAAKLGWYQPTGHFIWIGTNAALICFSVASLLEILGFMIPYIDHVLDLVAAPIAMLAGAIMSVSLFGMGDFLNDAPVVKTVLGILIGGGAAGAIQATTSVLRLGSTKLTGGIGNPLFTKIETLLALIISLISFWIPVIVGLMIVLSLSGLIYFLYSKFIKKAKHEKRNELP
jgi:Domain of unknown function (DUF4126)